ncbi:HD domain-containing protein [bacterium]|nr:HD domain-containing protein [bacterium]
MEKTLTEVACIQQKTALSLKFWFRDYVRTYHLDDKQYQRNIDLKYEHTLSVCKEIIHIGRTLNLSRENIQFAEITALFHDVGRFEQYRRYGTFVDLKSENHSVIGINILKEKQVLKDLYPETQMLIYRTIENHNRFRLPDGESEICLFFSKLLRDADKLDIWRVVIQYYQNMHLSRNSGIELDLPDTDKISDHVYHDLMSEKLVRTEHLKTLNDFKLLQMGWIYDIYFLRTYELVQERRYLQAIRDTLPNTEKINILYNKLSDYVQKKITAGRS